MFGSNVISDLFLMNFGYWVAVFIYIYIFLSRSLPIKEFILSELREMLNVTVF